MCNSTWEKKKEGTEHDLGCQLLDLYAEPCACVTLGLCTWAFYKGTVCNFHQILRGSIILKRLKKHLSQCEHRTQSSRTNVADTSTWDRHCPPAVDCMMALPHGPWEVQRKSSLFPVAFQPTRISMASCTVFQKGSFQTPLSGGTGAYKPSSKKHELLFPWKLVILLGDIFMDLILK